MPRVCFAALTALLTLCLTTARADYPVVKALITDSPPLVDGVLDDSVWGEAVPVTSFFQREPVEGAPSTERTEVRIIRHGENLYIGFRCFDADPAQITANHMRRDGNLRDDDNVQVILDTYNDRRGGFFFSTNPQGARLDMALSNEGRTRNKSWDCVWSCRARVDSIGWSAEIGHPP